MAAKRAAAQRTVIWQALFLILGLLVFAGLIYGVGLRAVIVPGSLGVQGGGQVLIFAAFGLTAPLAVTFGLLRRGRELLWLALGFAVLIHHRALGWLRERRMAGRET